MDAQAAAPLALADQLDALAALLVAGGHSDAATIERGRVVARENGQRLDRVLIQLGLLGERGLAEAYGVLLGLPLADPARFPPDVPPHADRLSARFLRSVRALPLQDDGTCLEVAVADPLDAFTPLAIAAATGRRVALLVGVPIELDAALERLFPDPDGTGPAASADPEGAALRGRRRAPQGPGQRGAGHPPRQRHHRPGGREPRRPTSISSRSSPGCGSATATTASCTRPTARPRA